MTDRLPALTPDAVAHAAIRLASHARGHGPAPAPAEVELVHLAIVASGARSALDAGEGLTSGQLAALGGVDDRHVRRLMQSGALPSDGAAYAARIPADACQAWLARVEARREDRAVRAAKRAAEAGRPKRPRGRPPKVPRK